MDFELRKLEIEAQTAQAAATAATTQAIPPLANFPQGPKNIPRLPVFRETQDDVDAFLFRFEAHASLCKWNRDQWPIHFAATLQGPALTFFHSLCASGPITYDVLKEHFLKKYRCTTEGFREKFRQARPDTGESFPAYLTRLRHYLDRWISLAGIQKDYNGLNDLLMREQLLHSVSKELCIYLKEKKFDTVDDMAKSAELFREARPNKFVARKDDHSPLSLSFPQANTGHVQPAMFAQSRGGRGFNFRGGRGTNGRFPPPQNYSGQSQPTSSPSFPPPSSFQARGGASNRARGAQQAFGPTPRPKQDAKPNLWHIQCHKCGGMGHYASKCSSLQYFHKALSCKVLISTNMGHQLGKLNLFSGYANDQHVVLLRDTGCTTAGIRKCFVKEDQYTGKTQKCISFGGKIETFPLANVPVCTPFFSGTISCCVIENPVTDLILGNLPGISDLPQADLTEAVSLVTTRLQEQRDKERTTPLFTPLPPELLVTKQEFIVLQEKDLLLKPCFLSAKSGVVSHVGNATVSYSLCDGILCRFFQDSRSVTKQILVPQPLHASVLSTSHDAISAGHCGVRRTLQRILLRFFWPGVRQAVRQYCKTCDVCQKTKAKGRVPPVPLNKMPIIDIPFQRIAVDLIGPLSPTSKTGFRWVLTVMDVATRFPEAVPLKTIDTVTVAEALMTIFSRVGYPEEILSDCGTQFVSDLMKQIYRLLSIRSVHTTPYHAQSNGLVERFNGTLKSMLKKVVKSHPEQWDRYIPSLLFAYRELPNESTGFSPFELLFGRRPRGPIDILARAWTDTPNRDDGKPLYQYVCDLKQILAENIETVRDNVKHATAKHKYYFDKKTVPRTFDVGDEVLVLLPTDNNKLLMSWRGPFKISKTMGCDYEITMGPNKKKVFHANMLQRYFRRLVSTVVAVPTTDSTVPQTEVIQPNKDPVISFDVLSEHLPFTHSDVVLPDYSLVSVIDDEQDVSIPTLPSLQHEGVADVNVDANLTSAQTAEMKLLLHDFTDIFTDKPGCAQVGISHEISLTSDIPVRLKPYPLPFLSRELVDKEVQSMLNLKVIEPSNSPYSSPIVLVKKPDKSVRFCIDFRQLNKITVFDAEPIPDVDEIFSQINKAKFFTKIDLAKGYWQIPVKPSDRHKTAFQTAMGLFQWTRMPFGLVTAPATFARMMRKLDLVRFSSQNFFDDILTSSTSWSKHLTHLKGVLSTLRNSGLTIRPTKMFAGFQELNFLGHTVSAGVLKPQTEKVQKILSFPRPTTKKQIRSLLGLLSYYRKFLPNFASIVTPLTDLTKGSSRKPILWSDECTESFCTIQKMLTCYPILRLPDMSLPFIVRTDASNTGIGAVLLQEVDGLLHPVTFISRRLLDRESRYSVIERECLSIIWAVQRLSRYLWGKTFVLETDHHALAYLQSVNFKNSRLTRWALSLQGLCFSVRPISGDMNRFADIMSRSDIDQELP